MTTAVKPSPIREAVAYFENGENLEAAIDELLRSGFDRAEISLLASERAVEDQLGHRYDRVSELEDDPTVPRTFYVPTESVGGAEGALIATPLYLAALSAIGGVVASGGSLLALLVGTIAAGGAGGALGVLDNLGSLPGGWQALYDMAYQMCQQQTSGVNAPYYQSPSVGMSSSDCRSSASVNAPLKRSPNGGIMVGSDFGNCR